MSDGVTFPIPEKEVYKLVKKGLHKMFKGNPSREQFDDLVQDTMLRLIEVMPFYDEKKGSFSNFVYMQVRHAIWRDMVHYSAKSRIRDFMIHSLDFVSPSNDDEETVLSTFADNRPMKQLDEELRLQDILKHFNPEEQQLIKEFYFQKKTFREMAKKRNIEKRKMATKMTKIKTKLKEVIDEGNIRQQY
jgi:RNA polymerase sigma factor (sigma-70 family)